MNFGLLARCVLKSTCSDCFKKLFCNKFINEKFLIDGGERGIRTLGSIATTHAFQAC